MEQGVAPQNYKKIVSLIESKQLKPLVNWLNQ
jgi:hypothetical protein